MTEGFRFAQTFMQQWKKKRKNANCSLLAQTFGYFPWTDLKVSPMRS